MDITKFYDKRGVVSAGKLRSAGFSSSEELYLEYHNIERPTCEICNSEVKYYGFKKGFSKTCSVKCANKIREIKKGKVHDTESFIKKAKEIHGDLYDYSLVEYKKAHDKVKIICKEHGIFEQIPYNHNQGKDCEKCSYLSREKQKSWTSDRFKNIPTILYYIKLKEQNLYKIGITKRSVKERFSKEELDNIEIISEILYQDGSKAFEEEYKILKENKEFQYKGENILRKGNTELFTKDIFLCFY